MEKANNKRAVSHAPFQNGVFNSPMTMQTRGWPKLEEMRRCWNGGAAGGDEARLEAGREHSGWILKSPGWGRGRSEGVVAEEGGSWSKMGEEDAHAPSCCGRAKKQVENEKEVFIRWATARIRAARGVTGSGSTRNPVNPTRL